MLPRKQRRWRFLSMDYVKELAKATTSESIWGDNFSRPNLVTSDNLSGKSMTFRYDDGSVWKYTFFDERHLHWSAPDGEGDDLYNATVCPGFDNVIFFHHYRAGLDLPRCADVILDTETGYCVLFDAYIGNPDCPREVVHDIRFGHIEGIEAPEGAVKPHFTNELTGKAIQWAHDDSRRGIQYIFSSCQYYTYSMRFRDPDCCWMATNPADYLKFADNLYILSVIEERQPGVQLVMLMNLNIMRDVQSCFGIGGTIEDGEHIETWMHANRKGRFVEMSADLTGES